MVQDENVMAWFFRGGSEMIWWMFVIIKYTLLSQTETMQPPRAEADGKAECFMV